MEKIASNPVTSVAVMVFWGPESGVFGLVAGSRRSIPLKLSEDHSKRSGTHKLKELCATTSERRCLNMGGILKSLVAHLTAIGDAISAIPLYSAMPYRGQLEL